MSKVPITKIGLINLQKELSNLKHVKRINIINSIKKAREFGDLKENAEYHAAKEEQYLNEKKIKNIENKILNANVIDISKIKNNNKVIFGATVELENLCEKKFISYTIVGEDEADIKFNKISILSPLARALILRSVNDIITININKNETRYKIIKISYI